MFQVWYSFCSAHQAHDPSCPQCLAGGWRTVDWLEYEKCEKLGLKVRWEDE